MDIADCCNDGDLVENGISRGEPAYRAVNGMKNRRLT